MSLVLDLAHQPLANDFLPPNVTHEKYPLTLNRCEDCFHAQLGIAVNPSRLFREYSYVSGTSQTLSEYFISLKEKIVITHGEMGKILDIGSNDGSFLSTFNETRWNSVGVDPAINLIAESVGRGVKTLPTFFTKETSEILASDFDVIVAMNVFAHTADPLDILLGIKHCLNMGGTSYIQTSQANMFRDSEFDTVYHEHISFFNVRSMKALLGRAGLALSGVDLVNVHGISYLWKVVHEINEDSLIEREQNEIDLGLYSNEIYANFAKVAMDRVRQVNELIHGFRTDGYKIVTYGAAAKGNTFLNFANVDLDFIFDDTPLKIGKMSPAGGQIVSASKEMSAIIDPLLILIPAWNFKTEILEKIHKLRENSRDYYLVYYPDLEVKQIMQ
jgi:SAM-dependent methyltransferase